MKLTPKDQAALRRAKAIELIVEEAARRDKFGDPVGVMLMTAKEEALSNAVYKLRELEELLSFDEQTSKS